MLRTLRKRIGRLRRRLDSNRSPRTARDPLALADWSRCYVPDHFTRKHSSFHQWLVSELDTLHPRRGTHLGVIAPRGSAKSTWASFAYPLRCAVEGYEPYIQIV